MLGLVGVNSIKFYSVCLSVFVVVVVVNSDLVLSLVFEFESDRYAFPRSDKCEWLSFLFPW